MLNLAVIGVTSAGRIAVVEQLNKLLINSNAEFNNLAHLSVLPVAIDEIKFKKSPDIAILTEDCFSQGWSELIRISRSLPESVLIAHLGARNVSLSLLEQLAALGIDDYITNDTSSSDFSRKIVLYSAKKVRGKTSKFYLFEGVKGGVGVTSLVAGLAEQLFEQGLKVVVIDLDFTGQNLSRFLYCRPFVNENLSLMLGLAKPVTQEMIHETLANAWGDGKTFQCLTPPLAIEESQISQIASVYLQILSILDKNFDVIIADAGTSDGSLLKMFRKLADKIFCIFDCSEAALYSGVQVAKEISRVTFPIEKVSFLLNKSSKIKKIRVESLISEFNKLAGFSNLHWSLDSIPDIPSLSAWPLSGSTIYSLGSGKVKVAFKRIFSEKESAGLEENNTRLKIIKKITDLLNSISKNKHRDSSHKNTQQLLDSENQLANNLNNKSMNPSFFLEPIEDDLDMALKY